MCRRRRSPSRPSRWRDSRTSRCARDFELVGLGLVASLVVPLLVLAIGCASEADIDAERSATAASLAAGDIVVVGVARDLPPYAFLDDAGRPRGLTVELTRAIAEVQGLEIELRLGTVPELHDALATGDVDVVPHVPYSVELEERFALSLPHTDVADGLFVRADEGPANLPAGSSRLDWLARRDLIVLADDPSLDFARSVLEIDPAIEASPAEALRALAAGEGDCALVPARTGVLLARDLGLSNVRILPTTLDGYSRGLAFATRRDDTDLLQRFDDGMVILTETGRYLEIYNRWTDAAEDPGPLGRILVLLLASSAALLVLSTAWSWQLRRQVARRADELQREAEERRRAESALAASEEKYRGLFVSSRDAIAFFDLDGAFVDANPAALAMLGTDIDGLRSTTIVDWTAPRWRPLVTELTERVDQARAADGWDVELRRDDGRSLPVSVRLWRVHDDTERPIGSWGILQDLTAQRRDEEETRRLERQIQQMQKLESLGVLAGGVAHDFNNLLTAILGHTSLALQDLEPGSKLHARLTDVQSAGQRAADLCRQMLAYSGRGRMTLEPIDLSDLVRDMDDLLVASVDARVVVELDLADDLPPIRGDRSQLRQVVMNLVSNGADAHGDTSGVVRVRTRAQHCDERSLEDNFLGELLEPGRYQILEVGDTGVGMTEETMSRMFEPFFSTKFTGRGLGLAATLGIVHGHHGAVQVESQVGLGTTVRVILPFAAVDDESHDARTAPVTVLAGAGGI